MVVCEIGLNHLGSENYANEYVDILLNSKIDAITFQVREKSFYDKRVDDDLTISDEFYFTISERIKKRGKKFGIAIADIKKIDFFNSINTDFYKVISNDILNLPLIEKLLNTNDKNLYVSTGTSNVEMIKKLERFLAEKKKRVTLIHTQLSNDIKDVNLSAIPFLREEFDMHVAFGNHCSNHFVNYIALGYSISSLFLYVKGNRSPHHPDDNHAIPLNELPKFVNNINQLKKAIGNPVKLKMENLIERRSNEKSFSVR